MEKGKGRQAKKQKPNQTSIYILYLLLFISIVAYIVLSNEIIGAMAFVLLIVTLLAELRSSVQEEGARRTVYEIITAVIGVILFFAALTIILQARFPPVSAVASCSMLPTLHRGDLVVLHGIPNMTSFLASHDVPVINVSAAQMNYTIANINNEFLAYFAYDPQNKSKISDFNNGPNVPIGLYNTYCLDTYSALGQYQDYYRCFFNGSQSNNLVQYGYGFAPEQIGNTTQSIIVTQNITIGTTQVNEDYNNPIIVYQTTPSDSFTGDIVHRLVAAIRSGNQYYLLTKGDNNQGLDMQFSNYPVTQNNTLGYVITDIPAVGYLKLIISGQVVTPAGCNTTIIR